MLLLASLIAAIASFSPAAACNDAMCHDQLACATEGLCHCGYGGKVCTRVDCGADLDCETHSALGLKWKCHPAGFCKLATRDLPPSRGGNKPRGARATRARRMDHGETMSLAEVALDVHDPAAEDLLGGAVGSAPSPPESTASHARPEPPPDNEWDRITNGAG